MPAAHMATTANLGAAYPFIAESGLGSNGVLIGRDLLGGSFTYDPFELYARGIITNPNMVIFGQIGRGKSSLVKSYLWRQSVFGRRAWVVDPKGEYGALAAACGVEPIRLRPGGPVRLNPLDRSPSRTGSVSESGGEGSVCETIDPGEIRRQAALLNALASASLGRALEPGERTALEMAVADVFSRSSEPTLPAVVEALLDPSEESARSVRTKKATLAAEGRDAALELRRLVAGDLQGMFDGPTTPGVNLSSQFVVLDLSAVYSSAALGILMTCASAWLQSFLDKGDGHKRIVVVDEAWAILTNLGVARWLRSSWKLSRAHGVSNVAVLHRVSDLDSVGASGSEQVGLAQGLLSDSETRVVYAQPPGEIESARDLLGLTGTEARILPRLGRGVALWKAGRRSFLVEHCLGHLEKTLVDTDLNMGSSAVLRVGV